MFPVEAVADSVAFLGPPTSYTHQAVLQHFGSEQYTLKSQGKISDVFPTVQSGHARFGVVPFENSSYGTVDMTLDCLVDRSNENSDVKAVGEVYVHVEHCLLGRALLQSLTDGDHIFPQDSVHLARIPLPSSPVVDYRKITDVYSHPQALGQCQAFLNRKLNHAKTHEVASTSEAASIVARKGLTTAVAISSQLAGQHFGLDVLASSIQDEKDNQTRFLILQKVAPTWPTDSMHLGDRTKALVSFSMNHNEAGALAEVLHIFKQQNLNLTSINSRPSGAKAWHYIFLVECEHAGTVGDLMHHLTMALSELDMKGVSHRVVGCWEVLGTTFCHGLGCETNNGPARFPV